MMLFVLVILGLVFGSFSNAAVWRLHEQQKAHSKHAGKDLSIVTGRSICTHCGHELAARDLIPVVSYMWLRGRCRYCHKLIVDTPVAELLMPALLVASYIWWPFDRSASGLSLGWILFDFWVIFLIGFVILALYDLRWLLLPDRVVLPLAVLAVLEVAAHALLTQDLSVLISAGWGVLVVAGLFYLLYRISQGRWIGFGDVKLAVVLGLLVGGPLPALLVIFLASLFGSVAAVPMLVKGKSMATTRIPFGPFLLLATVVVILFGSNIVNWYTGLLVR